MFNVKKKSTFDHNLLHPLKVKKKKGKKKIIIISIMSVLGIFIGGAALGAAIYVPRVKQIVQQANNVKTSFNQAQSQLLAQNFSEGWTHITNAEQSLVNIQQSLEDFAWVRHVPYARTQYAAAFHVTDSAMYMTEGIKELVTVVEDILTPLQSTQADNFKSISDPEREQILAALYNSQNKLQSIQMIFNKAVEEMEKVPEKGLMRQLRDALAPIQVQAPQLNSTINSLAPLSHALPTFFGYPHQQDYLLLFQNNTELRPTGGFIGTYGIVKLRNADVLSLVSDNVYNLDEPAKEQGLSIDPPDPLYQYNKVTQWFLRDSNWSPDFPTSAQQALTMYRLEGGSEKNLDGVIALDPTFIVSLLGITGPVLVGGTEFTTENFVQKLQEHVSQGFQWKGIDVSERKDIIGELGDVLMDKLYTLPKLRWQEIFISLEKNLAQKHLLIWSKNSEVQELVDNQGWGGRVSTDISRNDLFIVDANLASLKTDPAVSRSTSYEIVEQENGTYLVSVKRTYANTGTLNWKTTRYRTFTRIYVPAGSTLVSADGAMIDCKKDGGKVETSEELSHTVFSFFICIEPEEERSFRFSYQLPTDRFTPTESDTEFSIHMIKQPGTPGDALSLSASFLSTITGITPHLDKIHQISNTQSLLNDTVDRDAIYTFSFD